MLLLEERGGAIAHLPGMVYVASMDGTRADAEKLTRDLRRSFRVDCDLEGRGMGAQMKQADKAGARVVVLLGEDEWKKGEVVIKDLVSGDQSIVSRTALEDELRRRLA